MRQAFATFFLFANTLFTGCNNLAQAFTNATEIAKTETQFMLDENNLRHQADLARMAKDLKVVQKSA